MHFTAVYSQTRLIKSIILALAVAQSIHIAQFRTCYVDSNSHNEIVEVHIPKSSPANLTSCYSIYCFLIFQFRFSRFATRVIININNEGLIRFYERTHLLVQNSHISLSRQSTQKQIKLNKKKGSTLTRVST